MSTGQERVPCPSCGGAGGGPFGPAGSIWDDEDFVCSRCKGVGVIPLDDLAIPRPGLVKAQTPTAAEESAAKKRKATG